MPLPADLDLTRARASFEAWRSAQSTRRRIPEHLWQAAIKLLDHYSLTRVCRELRLSPTQLRKHLTHTARPRPHDAVGPSAALNFVEVRGADLPISDSTSQAGGERQPHTPASVRLLFERSDGARLTLCLPAADYVHLTALCATFFHAA